MHGPKKFYYKPSEMGTDESNTYSSTRTENRAYRISYLHQQSI